MCAVSDALEQEEAIEVRARGGHDLAAGIDKLEVERLVELGTLEDRAFHVAAPDEQISTTAGTPGRGTTTCISFSDDMVAELLIEAGRDSM